MAANKSIICCINHANINIKFALNQIRELIYKSLKKLHQHLVTLKLDSTLNVEI